jgi:large repetitive protein
MQIVPPLVPTGAPSPRNPTPDSVVSRLPARPFPRHSPSRLLTLVTALFWAGHVVAAPAVTSFSPAMGGPGKQVVVQGAGFTSVTKVQFDSALADFAVTADNRLVAVVPDHATTGRIRVTNPTGTGSSATDFMVAPRITEFDPVRSATNTAVRIDGFNFLGTTGVQIDGQDAAFTVTAATQIRAMVPAGATNGPIRVTSPAGVATTDRSFLVTGPEPILDSFEPSIGAPGTEVIIRGANFLNLTAVRFNDVAATIFSAPAQSQIIARVPDTGTTGKIAVTTAAGTTTSAGDFVVTRAPVIKSFSPRLGRDGFTDVTIEGINFTGVTGVGFNGKPVTGISSPAQGQLLVRVPSGATTGPITITNASGVGTSSTPFQVTLAPIVEWFNPVLGGPGTPVTIAGVNLSNSLTHLRFNGVNAAFTVTGQGGTQIRTSVPADAKTGPITMSNSFGLFTTSSNFFVTGSVPYVTELAPGRGARGTQVIVTGGNFTSPVTVKFNGVTDPSAVVTAPTQIQATVPPGARTGPVTVTTAAGSSTNGPLFYAPPRLLAFVPAAAVVGQSVIFNGTNLTHATRLQIGPALAEFAVTGPDQITATIPADARTGPVTVQTPGGTYMTEASYTVLPRILEFSPLLGPPGTQVLIDGTTLSEATQVTFNHVNAQFTRLSSTQILATVPTTAGTGFIRVITPDGTAISPEVFLVTRDSDLQLTKTVSPDLVQPGDTVVYTLVASNRGPSIVTGVVLRDNLPAGLSFLNASIDRGTWTRTNREVTAIVGVLTNGLTVTLTIEAMAEAEGVLTNNAIVTAAEGDPASSNNRAQARLTVIDDQSRILTIAHGADPDRVVLQWPASPVPMTLQSTATLAPSATWSNVTTTPVLRNGFKVVTNVASAETRYYRLKGP